MLITLAIDPGKAGAIAALNEEEIMGAYDMPIHKVGSKNLVNPKVLVNIFSKYRDHPLCTNIECVIERVGSSPQMGTSSSFNFGHGAGVLEGVCAGMGLEYGFITPQKWKAYMGLLKKPKDAARLKVIKLFPEQADLFRRKKDVDLADAVLIGLTWRKFKK